MLQVYPGPFAHRGHVFARRSEPGSAQFAPWQRFVRSFREVRRQR